MSAPEAFVSLEALNDRSANDARRARTPRRTGPRVALIPLGCAKNLVDSEIMLGLLDEAGFRITGEPRRADVVIVNTCAFIDEAKAESIDTILSVTDGRPVIVAGCLAQRYPDQLLADLPEIAAVVGTNDFTSIVDVTRRVLSGERVRAVGHAAARYERVLPRRRIEAGPFAYVKIAEGCDHTCKFCAIPLFRGKFRSRPIGAILQECRALAEDGARELILVSQDTTYWGRDGSDGPRTHLGHLLRAVSAEATAAGARWIRCLYLYPYLLDDRILEAWAEAPGVLPYFDMPLQHGSDAMLAAMSRPDRRRTILELCARIRTRIPAAVLRTSFIVGYPGETESHFAEMLDLLRAAEFDHAGFFVYSAEDGTPAGSLPDQVPEALRHERYHRAMEAQAEIAGRRNAARAGQVLDVLVERAVAGSEGYYEGRWWGQAPDVDGTCVVRGEALQPGEIVPVRLEGADGFDVFGSVAGAPVGGAAEGLHAARASGRRPTVHRG